MCRGLRKGKLWLDTIGWLYCCVCHVSARCLNEETGSQDTPGKAENLELGNDLVPIHL